MADKPPFAIDTANLAEAGRLIRFVARGADAETLITFTEHAFEEMDKDGLDMLHVLKMLRGCKVIGLDRRGRYGEMRYKAVGKAEEIEIGAPVEIWEFAADLWRLKVVSCWKIERAWR